jgi:hypothetical protein
MMACQTGHSSVIEKIAIIMPAKPIMDPTERSNSPAIIKQTSANRDNHELGGNHRPVENALRIEHPAIAGERLRKARTRSLSRRFRPVPDGSVLCAGRMFA